MPLLMEIRGFQFDYVFDQTILKYQQSQIASGPPHALGPGAGPSSGLPPVTANADRQSESVQCHKYSAYARFGDDQYIQSYHYIHGEAVFANEKPLAWVGDEILPRESAKISVFDSVVQGGDAVWEGLRIYDGKVFKLDEHLDRLFDSAKALVFINVPNREEIKEAIFKTLIANGMFDNAHIRLTLTRGKKVTSGMSPAFNLYGCTLIG